MHNHQFLHKQIEKLKKEHKKNLHAHRITPFEEHDQAI